MQSNLNTYVYTKINLHKLLSFFLNLHNNEQISLQNFRSFNTKTNRFETELLTYNNHKKVNFVLLVFVQAVIKIKLQ